MLERVAMVLDALDGGRATATELARRTGLSGSTVHRLANSMVSYGFLSRGKDGRFGPGHRFSSTVLDNVALPHLLELRNATTESSQLWIRRGATRVCRLTFDTEHELRVTLPVGAQLELPAGSAGQILAQTPEARRSLAEHGWVESLGKRTQGIASVSAPVSVDGRTLAAVCVALPTSRLRGSPGEDLGAAVKEAARLIEQDLRQ